MAAVGPLVSKKVVPFVKILPLAMPRSNFGAPCQILAARVKLSNFGRPRGPYYPPLDPVPFTFTAFVCKVTKKQDTAVVGLA